MDHFCHQQDCVAALEPDTDAQLHKERVISVRQEAETCISSSTRGMSQVKCGLPGNFLSTRCGRVSGVGQGCAENCSDSTSAKIGTDDPDDDSQQGPEHADARCRADSSAVARYDVADLEQTSLR